MRDGPKSLASTWAAGVDPTNGQALVYDATNRLFLPADLVYDKIAARLRHSAVQSTANNTPVALTFDTEDYDSGGLHAAGNPTRLTAGIAGNYRIYGNVNWATGTGFRDLYIRKNGADILAYVRIPAVSGSGTLLTITTDDDLAAGDYVELVAVQNSGGALNVNFVARYSPVFGMRRVGEKLS